MCGSSPSPAPAPTPVAPIVPTFKASNELDPSAQDAMGNLAKRGKDSLTTHASRSASGDSGVTGLGIPTIS
jgi:hypothetical protein